MKSLYKTGYEIVSNKKSSIYILLACIAAKSVLIFFYSYTGRDKIYSLSASYNLLHGKGWTNSFFYPDDLSTEVLQSFCHWPPGYGLLVTPFQMIFRENIFLSTTLFEIICFIAFILLCRGILKTQKLSVAWINLSTILLSFFSHDFIETSLGTDLPALDFLLGFFYCSLLIWHNKDRKRIILLSVLAGLCLFLAGFTRYMYVPVCFFAALLLPLLSYWKKNETALRGFLAVMFICFAGLGAAMLFQDAACGSPFYTGIKEKGIFGENLSYWHPSAIAAVLNLNFVPVQLEKISSVSYTSWLETFGWINWGIYFLILVLAIRYFFKNRNIAAAGFPVFELMGFILSVAIISELVFLSFTNGVKYTVTGSAWTYITEGRYHAFPVVFMQLFLLKQVAKASILFRARNFYSFLLTAAFVLFLLTCIHQVYFTTKVGLNYRAMKQNVIREQDYVYFETLLKKTKNENPGMDILVASTDMYYPLLASIHKVKGIADGEKLNKLTPVVSKPSVLFIVISGGDQSRYADYLKKNDPMLIKELAGTKFYMQLINAGKKN